MHHLDHINLSAQPSPEWDVVIVGGGPAGLSAALVLGRCCRRVLICDSGTPRNWAAKEMHSYLTRDRITPKEFRLHARAELGPYENVQWRDGEVTTVRRAEDDSFVVEFAHGETVTSKKLLLATGVYDELPHVAGIEDFFGKSVFQCPYCDGWELRDSPIAVYGRKRAGFEMARAMLAWTTDIALCTDGPSGLTRKDKLHLGRNAIEIYEEPIARLEGVNGQLDHIIFASGRTLRRSALFFDRPSYPQSNLAQQLGCQVTASGGIRCGKHEASSIPGVFIAGNILKDVQLAIVAAAEGAKAAFGINRALTRETFSRNATGEARVEHPPLKER
jgi:thioredoxin reductase